MGRLRFGLFPLMGLVALIAGDLAMYRALFDEIFAQSHNYASGPAFCVVGLLPVLTITVIAGYFLVSRLIGRGEGGSFLSGFFVFSLIAAVGFTVLLSLAFDTIVGAADTLIETLIGTEAYNANEHSLILLWVSIISVPLLSIAVAGGLFFRWMGIRFARDGARFAGEDDAG